MFHALESYAESAFLIMGQTCLRSNAAYNLPTKIRILVEGTNQEEDLAFIPETLEALEQAVCPIVSRHLQLSKSDFIVLSHQRSPSSIVRLMTQKQLKTLLRQNHGRVLQIRVGKGSYQAAFDLAALATGDDALDSAVGKLRSELNDFRERFFQFCGNLTHLLEFTSHASIYMQHPSIETAVTAVLLTLSCEAKGDEAALSLSAEPPYINVKAEALSPEGLSVLRLWNDFVQNIPRLRTLTPALESHFSAISVSPDTSLSKPSKKLNPDHILVVKQAFADAAERFRAVDEQVLFTFLKFSDSRHQQAITRLRRISRHSYTTSLDSAVALFDLKGNAR